MSFVFLGQVRVPRPVRVAVAGLLVLLYMLVTGADPSVMRASVMATIGLLGWLIGRKGQPAALVSVAALAMLVYDPFLLFSVSFQLSFAATIGLICFTGPIVRLLVGVPRGLRELMAVTTAAQIGAGPLVAYYFGQMSVVSLLTNLAVVPVTGLILGIGLVASSVFAVSAVLAGPLYAVLDLLLTYVTGTAGFFGRLPGAVVYIGRFGAASVAVFYSAVVVFFWKVRRVNVVFPTGSIVIGFLAIFVIVLSSSALGAVPGEFTVSFLDLGDGEANLIRGPSGASVLIDGGGPPDVLVRKLRQRGVRQLDLVVVSHPHRDHIEGLARVMQTFPVGLVVEGVDEHDSPDYRQLSAAVRARRIKRRNVASGVRLRLGRIDVHILNPQATPILGTGSDENNNSVVARIDYENISLLFAGDVEAVTERRLVQQHGAGLRATVLKVPHQGSADAADKRFLGAVKARVAVIIVGAGDSYGHPASSTVRNLQRVGARIYRTDRDGDVSLVSDGKDYRILTMGAKKG
ncbi:MAG: ComEC/Rec2 family competence protein, partial [Terriglobia bacterium]